MVRDGFVSVWLLWKAAAPISGTWQGHIGHGSSGATKGGDTSLGRDRTSAGVSGSTGGSAGPRTVIISTKSGLKYKPV